ncbi:MAG: redoxin domain-containing protein, partial [Candidatus Dormibacteria bacterium]
YRSARLTLRTEAGTEVQDLQQVVLQVTPGRLTPLLFTFRVGTASPGLTATTAYAGNDQVNFGLKVAAGTVMNVPDVSLEDQAGQPLALSHYRGKIVVLASFLTECQETCPLVASALLQLHQLLVGQHLQKQVQIVEVSQDPADDTPAALRAYQRYFSLPWPLLTGSATAINTFWSQLKVPPIQDEPWGGPSPIDRFTGKPEPYNLIHASVVDIIDPEGYVVSELQDQPTLSTSSIPQVIYKYLDQQGREQQKAGGSWTPSSLLNSLQPLLEQKGVYTSLPAASGAATVGKQAPPFTLPSSAGGSVELVAQLGHPVLLDFWATWCDNCRADMHLVAKTAQTYAAQGLRVLLIDYQESRSTTLRFLTGLGVQLPTLLDRNASVADRYGVLGLPVAIFINRKGVITAIQVGQLQQEEVSQDLPTILSGS